MLHYCCCHAYQARFIRFDIMSYGYGQARREKTDGERAGWGAKCLLLVVLLLSCK